jgi:hypothetical protein
MKRPIPHEHPPKPDDNLTDAQSIDEKYGLEPIIDPSASSGGSPGEMQFHPVECPYCGESFETPVDTSAGSARYVEDCQICCQPIEFSVEVDHAGVLESLSTQRGDQ